MPYNTEVLADTPSHYLILNESSGAVAADSSGNGNDGAIANVAYSQPAFADSADSLGFGAGNALVTIPNSATLDIDADFAAECFIRPVAGDLSGFPMVLCKGIVNAGWLLFLSNGRPTFRSNFSPDTNVLSPTALVAGQDYHIVAQVEAGELKLWVNGVLVASGVTASFNNNTDALAVGAATNSSNPFAGDIGQVAVYPAGLTAARIAAHYAASVIVTVGRVLTPLSGNSAVPVTNVTGWRYILFDGTNAVITAIVAQGTDLATDGGGVITTEFPVTTAPGDKLLAVWPADTPSADINFAAFFGPVAFTHETV